MSKGTKPSKVIGDDMFAAVGEASKRMAKWDDAQAAKRKRKLTKVTKFVGVACVDGHFLHFDTLTTDERDAMWRLARERGEWPQDRDFGDIVAEALLPSVERGQRGRWRITVEFEPEEER